MDKVKEETINDVAFWTWVLLNAIVTVVLFKEGHWIIAIINLIGMTCANQLMTKLNKVEK